MAQIALTSALRSPAAALVVRRALAQGGLPTALQTSDLLVDNSLATIAAQRRMETLALAHLAIAQSRLSEAGSLLEGLAAAEGWIAVQVEAGALLALLRYSQGDYPSARLALHRTLAVAEPAGYLRTLAAIGPDLAPLLLPLAGETPYAARLLALIQESYPVGGESTISENGKAGGSTKLPACRVVSPEAPLSDRKL